MADIILPSIADHLWRDGLPDGLVNGGTAADAALFLRALWGGTKLPAGELFAFLVYRKPNDRMETDHVEFVRPALNLASPTLADEIAKLAALGADTYFHTTAQVDPRTIKKRRGSIDGAVAVAGFALDLDTSDGVHKVDCPRPTVDEALRLLDELPLPPSFIIASGGGLQPWWKYKVPILLTTAEEREAANADGQAFVAHFAKRWGFKFDQTGDLARVLRFPGTWNTKTDPPRPVRLLYAGGHAYEPEELRAAYPQPTKTKAKKSTSVAVTGTIISATERPPVPTGDELVRRVNKCLEWIGLQPKVTAGQDEKPHTFNAAIVFVRGWNLPDEYAFELLQEYNTRCHEPVLDDDILAHKITSARDKGKLKWGFAVPTTDWEDFHRRLEEALKGSGPPVEKPTIRAGTELPDLLTASLITLKASKTIFRRGGSLVHVVDDDATDEEKIYRRPAGAPRIAQVQPARLREELAVVADWEKYDARKEDYVPCLPPMWIADGIQARGEWPTLRLLRGVVEAPTLRPDGSVLVTPGYDRMSGIYYRPSVEFPAIEKNPSQERCVDAVTTLFDVVADFPFEALHHRSAWLAGLLTVIARYAFIGPSPLFLSDANTRGSGKSLLVDITSLIATGRVAARMSYTDDDAEMRKRITTIALSGDRLILLDNIDAKTALGGAALDAALTADDWKDRLLGHNEQISLPLTTTWFASGNNVTLVGDTSRRIAHVRLQSTEEKPEERRDIRVDDLRDYVRQRRPRLLAEALTILAGYCAAGAPKHNLAPWGSYETWSSLIREAIVWTGEADPAAGRQELRQGADIEASALYALVAGWADLVALRGPLTVRAAIDIITKPSAATGSPPAQYAGLRSALAELAHVSEARLAQEVHRIGLVLRRVRGRVVDGKAIIAAGADPHAKLIQWGVLVSTPVAV